MARVVMLIPGEWESMPLITNSFNDFQQEIYNIFFTNPDIKITNCKLILPSYVTIQERHRIHKYTSTGMDAISYGEIPNRVMEISFNKNYMQKIFDKYYIKPEEPEPEQVEEIENDHQLLKIQALNELKKAILDDLMILIDKHLNTEFLKYYN